MRNLILGLIFLAFLVSISGCKTVKGTAAGMAITAYGFGKGLADDAYDTWKSLEKADEWMKDNYW